MLDEWLDQSLRFARKPAEFYSGARKILRAQHFQMTDIQNDLTMAHCGFTKSKMTMLKKNYLHRESLDVAVQLWNGRLDRAKYGSVSFHCYNHYVKGMSDEVEKTDIASHKKSKRASVMGPCVQSVCLTLLNNGKTGVDVFYRTTEIFKKFPADLVFIRDELLPPFDLVRAPLEHINFHFANVTCHPMYFVTLLPSLEDPIAELEKLRRKDEYFANWIIKWTARYICPEHHRGIAKFAQALRTGNDAMKRLDKQTIKDLQKYLRDNHPGHRNSYEEADEEAAE